MDALARAGDEGRGTLRKAMGSCEQALIRGYPNGETHLRKEVSGPEYIGAKKRTRGTETSKYPEERTSIETPLVVASERGSGQWQLQDKPNRLESRAVVGDSPVGVMRAIVLE